MEWNSIVKKQNFYLFDLACKDELALSGDEKRLFSLQQQRFIFIIYCDSKIIVRLLYFDDILSMDVFHLHLLEMITK